MFHVGVDILAPLVISWWQRTALESHICPGEAPAYDASASALWGQLWSPGELATWQTWHALVPFQSVQDTAPNGHVRGWTRNGRCVFQLIYIHITMTGSLSRRISSKLSACDVASSSEWLNAFRPHAAAFSSSRRQVHRIHQANRGPDWVFGCLRRADQKFGLEAGYGLLVAQLKSWLVVVWTGAN